MPGRRLGDLLHPGPVLRVRIAEGFEVVRLADGVRDAAGDLKALLLEELLGLVERGVIHQQHVAVGLQVDLVHVQLAGDGLPGGFKPLGVFHLFHFIRTDIDGNGEILVLGLRGGRKEQESEQDQVQDFSHDGNRWTPFPVRAASTRYKDNNYLEISLLLDERVRGGHRLRVEGLVQLLLGHQAVLEHEVIDAAAGP